MLTILKLIQSDFKVFVLHTLSQLDPYTKDSSLSFDPLIHIEKSLQNHTKKISANIRTIIFNKQSILTDVSSIQAVKSALNSTIAKVKKKIAEIGADVKKFSNINTNPFSNSPLPDALVPDKIKNAGAVFAFKLFAQEIELKEVIDLNKALNQLLESFSAII